MDSVGLDASNFREELERSLGAAYRVERELGGGGMSRVFLAEERRFSRRVVVKVLAPELTAGVSVDRFEREIALMARLQHPNIVPLLAAGDVAGLPYFIMPFVEGNSLRARLADRATLGVPEAVPLLRDVARALAYAHGQGVVHRDIKPDNVLICDGAASVTDFGVAKALARARALPTPAGTLTRAGTSLGTPAYMAPEQASGDPTADHRADIYSWGVMGYEMLAGRTPFAGRAAYQILAAQLTESPPPLAISCPDVPPTVVALIMRCLATNPAARPQAAAELVAALDAAASPGYARSGPTRRFWPRRMHVAGLVALLVATVGVGTAVARRSDLARAIAIATRGPAQLHAERVVVAPFENETGDPTLDPLGNLAADWVTEGLARTGVVRVVDARTAMLDAKIVDNTPWLLRRNSRVKALAEETGAASVVWGRYYRDGDSLHFEVQITDAASGRLVRTVDPVAGRANAPARLVERLRERTMAALAMVVDTGSSWNVAMSQPPNYLAYQEAVAGFESYARFDTAAAFRHLRRAAGLDSGYLLPSLIAAFAYADMGVEAGDARLLAMADSALAVARAREARMAPGDRALADYVGAQLSGDAEGVLQAAKELTRLTPGSASPVLAARAALNANRPLEAAALLAAVPPDRGILLFAPAYWYALGDALHAAGDYAAELEAAGRARRQFGDVSGVRAMPVSALAGLGRGPECTKAADESAGFRSMRSITASLAHRRHAAAVELRAHGQPRLARQLLQQVLDATSSDVGGGGAARERRALRARALYDAGFWSEAGAAAGSFASAEPGNVEWRGLIGLVAARVGDRAAAARAASELAASREPYYFGAEATLYRARIAALLGDRDEAVALLRRALADGAAQRGGVHRITLTSDFDSLRDYAPFRDIIRPRG